MAEDDDLDSILASALDDIDLQEEEAEESKAEAAAAAMGIVEKPTFGPEPPPAAQPELPELPADLDETMKEFMKELENGDLKKMMEEAEQDPGFKQLMEALTGMDSGAAGSMPAGPGAPGSSAGEQLGDEGVDATLKMLTEAMEQIEKDRGDGSSGMGGMEGMPEMSAEEMEQIKKMLGGLGENSDFQGYLEKLMSQMMSKEILEAPMKQIDEKYMTYFATRTLSADDEAQFRKQHEYVKAILQEYEKEGHSTEKVAQLMQDMQECGQPPPEIVKELAGAMGGDGLGAIPGLQGLDPNCSVM